MVLYFWNAPSLKLTTMLWESSVGYVERERAIWANLSITVSNPSKPLSENKEDILVIPGQQIWSIDELPPLSPLPKLNNHKSISDCYHFNSLSFEEAYYIAIDNWNSVYISVFLNYSFLFINIPHDLVFSILNFNTQKCVGRFQIPTTWSFCSVGFQLT